MYDILSTLFMDKLLSIVFELIIKRIIAPVVLLPAFRNVGFRTRCREWFSKQSRRVGGFEERQQTRLRIDRRVREKLEKLLPFTSRPRRIWQYLLDRKKCHRCLQGVGLHRQRFGGRGQLFRRSRIVLRHCV